MRSSAMVALGCSLLLTACGLGNRASDQMKGRQTRAAHAASPSGPTGAWLEGQTSKQVVAAWTAAERSFETAALAADPSEPALVDTTVSPQLETSQAVLQSMRAAGEIARGPTTFGPAVVLVTSARLATVTACGHDAEIVVSARSGQPVAGMPGQVDYVYFTSTMELTSSGWKLADQSVGVGACDHL